MTSRIKTGEGVESQLTAKNTGVLQQHKRFDKSYGAMTMVLGYLPRIEQLRLQGLDKWWYETGVGRVQLRIQLVVKMFYLLDSRPLILGVDEKGEHQWLDCKGLFSERNWVSCQVGLTRLFQVLPGIKSSFRILKSDPAQRCFTIEREGDLDGRKTLFCLANFKDQFVFLLPDTGLKRYSLAENKWEQIPGRCSVLASACSLGDKVYVLCTQVATRKNCINVLHNPGVSISSQEPPHWQEIEAPSDVFENLFYSAFVPLNSAQIAILGGRNFSGEKGSGVITFDTTTNEFKKEIEDKVHTFSSRHNQSAYVYRNTIIALVMDIENEQTCLIKYTKGDTKLTSEPLALTDQE